MRDPARTGNRARFEREAQAVAALNHPNIVTIHSVEQAGDIHFITMELVDGKLLTELIPRHGLPLNRLLGYALALTETVIGAHRKGVIHRDLKPDNLMLSHEEELKVLDFGLAKLREETQDPTDDETAVATREITREGKVLAIGYGLSRFVGGGGGGGGAL